jgi:hypothetical protein
MYIGEEDTLLEINCDVIGWCFYLDYSRCTFTKVSSMCLYATEQHPHESVNKVF